MLCTDEIPTTASHRSVIPLPTYLLVEGLMAVQEGGQEPGEPAPTAETLRTAINIVTAVPFLLLGEPDISSFYGEIHMSWRRNGKQIVLMCFPGRTPLIHHYAGVAGVVGEHDIEEATAERLAIWLRWLRE
jgi:hypothetical protein